MTTFRVTETFTSIQGEGKLQGVASTFIRLAHCNLSCSWCDAAYTWKGDVRFDEVDLDDLLERVDADHVVITGGEPTFADGFDELVEVLSSDGRHITVETNGTILREAALPHVDLWSLSPKLGSSMQAGSLRFDVVLAYLAHGRDAQLKYVVDSEADFADVLAHLWTLQAADALGDVNVYMQPNGLCHIAALKHEGHTLLTDTRSMDGARTVQIEARAEDAQCGDDRAFVDVTLETDYLDRVRWLYERVILAEQRNESPCTIRATVQAHKLAWGNRRGF